jgi:MoxR-like ATPase
VKKADHQASAVLREPAERRWAAELAALASNDGGERPAGWALSPSSVRAFICGSGGKALAHEWRGAKTKTVIERKFYGDDVLVERAIVTLAGSRALMLVGEPGTAKSLLSELLAAAISGSSIHLIQGTAATTEDQIRYSWNYALLLAEGPTPRALVPSPIYRGMERGLVVRFEEITRCAPEVQDTLVSVLSEKMMPLPELEGGESVLYAKPGFNVIATANVRDRGVHEMSSALKRRFNFETVQPIRDLAAEVELVERESRRQLADLGAAGGLERDVVELLVAAFQDLRAGQSAEGITVEKPSTVLSTAEAVAVAISAAIDARYYGKGAAGPDEVARHLAGTVFKDNRDDLEKLKNYFSVVVERRAKERKGLWAEFYKARRWLPG